MENKFAFILRGLWNDILRMKKISASYFDHYLCFIIEHSKLIMKSMVYELLLSWFNKSLGL